MLLAALPIYKIITFTFLCPTPYENPTQLPAFAVTK